MPKTDIDGSLATVFDKTKISFTNSGFTGGTGANAPTTTLKYDGPFDENALVFNLFKNTGTSAAPV